MGEMFLQRSGLNSSRQLLAAAQKKKFSIIGFFIKCAQIRCFLQIRSNLLKKSLIENFIFVQWTTGIPIGAQKEVDLKFRNQIVN